MSDLDSAEREQPQIYLITPPEIELSKFPSDLDNVLDACDVACVRLALSTHDEGELSRAADACREVTHARDIALVIETHFVLAERLGLDGVHLLDGPRQVRSARKALGPDAIVGSFCGTSRHDGISAAEAGADYVSFGPVGTSALGDGLQAETDMFAWWTEMIEVPVVAEGALTSARVAELANITDFLGLGSEVWTQKEPIEALKELIDALS